jgi:hypothetical protein
MQNEEMPSKLNVLLKDLENVLSNIDYGFSYQDILEKYKCNDLKQLFDLVYVRLIRNYYDKNNLVCLPMETQNI